MEERGCIRNLLPHSFYLIFERVPVWLLALPVESIKYVYLHDCSSLSSFSSLLDERKIDKRLYNSTINSIGRRRFIFTPAPHNALTLVSGTLPFLNEKSAQIGKRKAIYIVDKHLRKRRSLPHSHLKLHRLTHVMVGGCTTFETLYAYSMGEEIKKLTKLRRKLGDFLDYSLPPLLINTTAISNSYQMLLPWQRMQELVHYPTHFSHNGLGFRHLTIK